MQPDFTYILWFSLTSGVVIVVVGGPWFRGSLLANASLVR